MYTVISAVKSLYRNKFVNLTVTVSIALGMLFPMLVFCIGNVMVKAVGEGLALYPERTGSTELLGDIDPVQLKSDIPYAERVAKSTDIVTEYVSRGYSFADTKICGVGAGAEKIYGIPVISGRYFTEREAESSERLCCISTSLQKELDCRIGDKAKIGDGEFTVIGVFAGTGIKALLPLQAFSELFSSKIKYDILLKEGYNIENETGNITEKLSEKYAVSSLTPFNTQRNAANDLNYAVLGLSAMFGIVSLVLVYSALNVSNILTNKMQADRKNYIIKIQLGASKKDIFAFLAVQLLLLMLLSVIIDIAATVLIGRFMPYAAGLPFAVGPIPILLTIATGVLYILMLTSEQLKKFYRKGGAAL